MPVYEYKCEKCGFVFETIILKQKEEEMLRCPKCEGDVKRILSVPQEPILL